MYDPLSIEPDKEIFMSVKLKYFSTHQFKQWFLGAQKNRLKCAQKNRLIETVLSSTHNICFG